MTYRILRRFNLLGINDTALFVKPEPTEGYLERHGMKRIDSVHTMVTDRTVSGKQKEEMEEDDDDERKDEEKPERVTKNLFALL